MWLRRRRTSEPLATAADLARLAERLASIERRMEDLEDLAAVALGPDRVDELAARVDDLALSAVTHDELLELRLASASVAAGLTGLTEAPHGGDGDTAAGGATSG